MEEVTTWTHVLDTSGEETTTLVFDHVLDPARIRERKPYPGSLRHCARCETTSTSEYIS